jgi:hypothetical protein
MSLQKLISIRIVGDRHNTWEVCIWLVSVETRPQAARANSNAAIVGGTPLCRDPSRRARFVGMDAASIIAAVSVRRVRAIAVDVVIIAVRFALCFQFH